MREDELNEIWALYADDGGQALDQVEAALLTLKNNTADKDAVASLFRGMHTFKGNARLLGLSVSKSRAHLAEDLIGLVRDKGVPLDSEMHTLLMEAADMLRGMLDTTLATRHDVAEEASASLAQRMREKYARCTGVAPPSAPAAEGIATISAPENESATLAPEAEAATQSTEAAPQPEKPLGALIFEPEPEASLGEDPVYREIFLSMAQEVITEMVVALGKFGEAPDEARASLKGEIERLHHAATQIGMKEWLEALEDFATAPAVGHDEAAALICRLNAMRDRDEGALKSAEAKADANSTEPVAVFFRNIEPLLAELAALDPQLTGKGTADPARLTEFADKICKLATPTGFEQLAAIAAQLAGACADPKELRHLQFRFYEELALIEEAAIAGHLCSHIHAGAYLRTWCAERVFDTVIDLNAAMMEVRQQKSVVENCGRIGGMLRQVHYACQHYKIETAGQLAMALVDLFERVLSGELAADPVLLHVFKSFISSLEMVFSTASAGEAPDLAGIEALLQEAEKVPFAAAGTMTAPAVEARLGLPKSFRRVLTPESVKAAVVSLDAGHHFYIVNADLEAYQQVGEAFLNWIATGGATIITNVTKFGAGVTAFDFLLASPLPEAEFAEAMARIDPAGQAVRIEMALTDRKAAGQAAASEEIATERTAGSLPADDLMSRTMLASIGEIVTGHAQVRHLLASFAKEDPMQIVETELGAAGGSWNTAKEAIRVRLRGWQDSVERLMQVELQLAGRLDRLQEEAIAVRTRPASLLIKPLVAFGETLARNRQREVAITTAGDDVALDTSMLENFKAPLRSLLSFAVAESIEPTTSREAAGKNACGHVHLSLARQADHISITVEDDGQGLDLALIGERARQLGWPHDRPAADMVLRDGFGKIASISGGESIDFCEIRDTLRSNGGDLRIAARPGGGVTTCATLPLAMVVLDGMVVRVGDVMYVVPIDTIQLIVHPAASAMMKVSAGDGSYMLRLENGDVLPVRFLMRNGGRGSFSSTKANTGLLAAVGDGAQKRLFVVAGSEQHRVALSIDELIGQQLVLIRPLQGYLAGIRGVTGCALLGSGDVGMVLDIGFVVNQATAA